MSHSHGSSSRPGNVGIVTNYYRLDVKGAWPPTVFRTREDESSFRIERFVSGRWLHDPSLAMYLNGEPDLEMITSAETIAILASGSRAAVDNSSGRRKR